MKYQQIIFTLLTTFLFTNPALAARCVWEVQVKNLSTQNITNFTPKPFNQKVRGSQRQTVLRDGLFHCFIGPMTSHWTAPKGVPAADVMRTEYRKDEVRIECCKGKHEGDRYCDSSEVGMLLRQTKPGQKTSTIGRNAELIINDESGKPSYLITAKCN
jgi:hypothetical protein